MCETPEGDPRVRIRRSGAPDPDGRCVVYWMNRAQRAADNPALDLAIAAGNALRKPVVVFFGLHAFVERAVGRIPQNQSKPRRIQRGQRLIC